MSKPEPTYWNTRGKYQREAEELHAMIPADGQVVNPRGNIALERFRKASNCYYDLYNNGLCNRAAEFRSVFGFGGTFIAKSRFTDAEAIAKLDAAMDTIIRAAAQEQGIA
jgi:hypothetical protein